MGDLRRGYEAQRKAHLLLEKNGLSGTLFWVGALHNEATALENMGELREALEVQSQVVRFGRQQDPHGCGTNPAVLNLFARLLLRLGRGAEAVDVLEQARACSQRSGDMESWSFATAARALALVSVARLTEAGAMLDEFGRANRSSPKLNLRAVSRAKIARAYWLAANGERAAARALSAELLSEVRKPELGMMQFLDDGLLLASRLALPENVALAQNYAEQALRIDESRSRVAENSADVGEAALVLAQACLAARNLSGAQNAAERAKSILSRTLGSDHALTRAAQELIRETRRCNISAPCRIHDRRNRLIRCRHSHVESQRRCLKPISRQEPGHELIRN
jgi:tetratricopeptide (TPR) repeat protein